MKKHHSKKSKWIRVNRKREATRPLSPAAEAQEEWYVPFQDGHACFYHAHGKSHDHSLCGPEIFCCPNAARVLLSRYPKAIPSPCEWDFTDAEHLLSWNNGELQRMYFFYCNPDNHDQIHFVGLPADYLTDVLRRNISLQEFNDSADTIDFLESPSES
jgi:hypothetical protein